MEDDNHFYLFLNRSRAQVLDKNGFVKGSEELFREFLRGKIETKKFQCMKKHRVFDAWTVKKV